VPNGKVTQVIRSNPACIKDWLKALRLHQWMKNALIFVPLLAAQQLLNIALLWQAARGVPIVRAMCFQRVSPQ